MRISQGAGVEHYRLYGGRQTGSMAIEAALAEAGVPYQMVDVARDPQGHWLTAFRAINPRGQVPVLILPDGATVTEGPAILSHLADAHPQARLAPAPGSPARARHDRWMAFFHANVYEAMLREMNPARYTEAPDQAPALARAATAYVRQHFQIMEGAFGEGPYLLGPDLAMFDIYLWMLVHWVDAGWLAQACPRIARMAAMASARPALKPVLERHFG
jgi:glutathione S-transferase